MASAKPNRAPAAVMPDIKADPQSRAGLIALARVEFCHPPPNVPGAKAGTLPVREAVVVNHASESRLRSSQHFDIYRDAARTTIFVWFPGSSAMPECIPMAHVVQYRDAE